MTTFLKKHLLSMTRNLTNGFPKNTVVEKSHSLETNFRNTTSSLTHLFNGENNHEWLNDRETDFKISSSDTEKPTKESPDSL